MSNLTAHNDKALLAAARRAQHEGETFTAMYRTVQQSTNGALELLAHVANGNGNGPTGKIDWVSIASLIQDCRDRVYTVEVALSHLREYERASAGEDGARA